MSQPISGIKKPGPSSAAKILAEQDAPPAQTTKVGSGAAAAKSPQTPNANKVGKAADPAQDAYATRKPAKDVTGANTPSAQVARELSQGAEASGKQLRASINDAFGQWASENKTSADAASWPKFAEAFTQKLQQAGVSAAAAQTALEEAAPSSLKAKGKSRDLGTDREEAARPEAQKEQILPPRA